MTGLLREAITRFKQLDYLHSRVAIHREAAIAAVEVFVASIHTLPQETDPAYQETFSHLTQPLMEMADRTTLYAEMFYIVAFRQIEITRYLNMKLFGKERTIAEPSGVRDVRNKLILHPEQVKDGPILSLSADFTQHDIRLKYNREPHESQDFADLRLGPNVDEFRTFWLRWWQKTYNALTDSSGEKIIS